VSLWRLLGSFLVSQLQNVSTVDLYYVCQVVDGVARQPGNFLRHIEDIFGDASSVLLVRRFPRWTSFHIFIEEVIASLIWENANNRSDVVANGLWIDHLLDANEDAISDEQWDKINSHRRMVDGYFDMLRDEQIIADISEHVAKQVFHVLFSNRGTMKAFGEMVTYYLQSAAISFEPDAFCKTGSLKRVGIPAWAKSAVFHRDKGRCVFCKTDLTKLFSQLDAINYDHIIPLAAGGANCVTNLQLSCSTCNGSKGARHSDTSDEYEVWFDQIETASRRVRVYAHHTHATNTPPPVRQHRCA